MNEFLKILLSLSLSGSLLTITLILLKKLYQDKFSKCWQYYIWLVVIARLLLPFAPEVSAEALAETVRRALAEETILMEKGRKSRERVEAVFSEENMLNRFEEIYRNLQKSSERTEKL